MKVCPTCSRPIGGNGRFCFACKLPVLRRHKWHIIGCYIVHDDCANPAMRVLISPPDSAVQTVLEPAPQPEEEKPDAA
jgi:hypothetical protein